MTKYVVPVPDPAPGADWQTVVPGIYTWDVVGITAQLATGTLDGQFYGVSYDGTSGVATFYLDGLPIGTASNPPLPVHASANTMLFGQPTTGPGIWDEPAYFNGTLGDGDMATMFAAASVSYATYVAAVLARTPIAYYHLDPFPSPGAVAADASGNGNDLTYDSNTGVFPMVPVPGLVPGGQAIEVSGTEIAEGTVAGIGTGSFSQIGWVKPGAFNQGLLLGFLQLNPGGETTWVLQSQNQPGTPLLRLLRVTSLSPVNIQQFDSPDGTFTPSVGTGRTPSLVVSNGTDDVLVIPAGFQAVTTPGPYGYAWQPGLNADTQSTDGTLTTVAIPTLIIPAGYTVGTQTFDLEATDQWSNIALWWDDVYQTVTSDAYDYGFPPGRYYTYKQAGT